MKGGLPAWSKRDVAARLLLAASNPRSAAQVARYFAMRADLFSGTSRNEFRVDLKGLAGPLHCSMQSGGLAIYYEIVSQQVYAPDPTWLPPPGGLVVDVGANIGVFSLWAAAFEPAPTVIAIEPNPLAYSVLSANTVGLPTVRRHEVACGAVEQSLTLRFPPGRLSVGSFDERPDRTEAVQVRVVPLDSLTTDVAGDIDLLKIDVEGFEYEVLSGAAQTLDRTHRLVLEIAGDDLEPCESLISRHGLARTGIRSGMWNVPSRHGVIAYFTRST